MRVTSSVIAVMAQRLVRRICTYCSVDYTPPKDELAFYRDAGGPVKSKFVHSAGCNFCAQTGYFGRIGVYELLELGEELRKLVVSGASRDRIRERAVHRHGMRTLREEGLRLVADDVTTIAEIARHIWTM